MSAVSLRDPVTVAAITARLDATADLCARQHASILHPTSIDHARHAGVMTGLQIAVAIVNEPPGVDG